MSNAEALKEFDKAFRNYRRARTKLGIHAALACRTNREAMERLLSVVDDARRTKYDNRDR